MTTWQAGNHARTAAGLVLAVAASVVFASAAGAGPSPAIPVISVTPASTCSQELIDCTTYDISIKNTGKVPLDDVTVAIVPQVPLLTFSLAGDPPGTQTGVQDAMLDRIDIAGGATGTGTFKVATPLKSTDKISVYTTTDGFASSVGQDVSLSKALGIHTGTGAAGATDAIEQAIQDEKEGSAAASRHDWTAVHQDLNNKGIGARESLRQADGDLSAALQAGEIDRATDQAIEGHLNNASSLDVDAARAASDKNATLIEHLVAEAIQEKDAALAVLKKATTHR